MNMVCDLDCNNGKCLSENGGFSCSCNSGWEGKYCDQTTRSACNPTPCMNGCSCSTDADDGFVCTNKADRYFLGNKCQYGEPTLQCNRDFISISTGLDILSDWERADGLGNTKFIYP